MCKVVFIPKGKDEELNVKSSSEAKELLLNKTQVETNNKYL